LEKAIRGFCSAERLENESLIARAEELAGLRPWGPGR
jgi:hypothetical protein